MGGGGGRSLQNPKIKTQISWEHPCNLKPLNPKPLAPPSMPIFFLINFLTQICTFFLCYHFKKIHHCWFLLLLLCPLSCLPFPCLSYHTPPPRQLCHIFHVFFCLPLHLIFYLLSSWFYTSFFAPLFAQFFIMLCTSLSIRFPPLLCHLYALFFVAFHPTFLRAFMLHFLPHFLPTFSSYLHHLFFSHIFIDSYTTFMRIFPPNFVSSFPPLFPLFLHLHFPLFYYKHELFVHDFVFTFFKIIFFYASHLVFHINATSFMEVVSFMEF